MGGGTFDPKAYRTFTQTTVGKTQQQVFTSTRMKKSLDPKGVKIRESRDSVDNPQSTPIIVATDVTGSMGELADKIARKGLGILFESILTRKPVTNPHMMFAAIGDVWCDEAPLQVSQFEADNRIIEQLVDTYIEGNGGGNGGESYDLVWYFAANHTEHDSLIKRGKRGYLFTVGDEPIRRDGLRKDELRRFLDDGAERDWTPRECLEAAQRMYDCYHIVIDHGSPWPAVDAAWKPLMGEHLIHLKDHTLLSETIVSTIEIAEGRDHGTATAAWGASANVVMDAVKNLPRGTAPKLLGQP